MNVYKFNDYREFLMEFARLNELTIVSFSDKYSEFFTRSSYGKLIHINKKTGEFTSHHIFDNDKFYKFLKYIGLKKDEADYIFLLKQKADTPENDLKRVYNRAINNIITVKSINNAKIMDGFSDTSTLIARTFELINSHCQKRMKKDAIKYLKTTALRTTDSKINSTINNVLKALESFL